MFIYDFPNNLCALGAKSLFIKDKLPFSNHFCAVLKKSIGLILVYGQFEVSALGFIEF